MKGQTMKRLGRGAPRGVNRGQLYGEPFDEARRLEAEIKKNLEVLGYGEQFR